MKIKMCMVAFFAVSAMSVQAAEYECKVYCQGPSGSIYVSVRADSSSEAAAIIDRQSDKICREAGHDRSTPSTMSASQCSRK